MKKQPRHGELSPSNTNSDPRFWRNARRAGAAAVAAGMFVAGHYLWPGSGHDGSTAHSGSRPVAVGKPFGTHGNTAKKHGQQVPTNGINLHTGTSTYPPLSPSGPAWTSAYKAVYASSQANSPAQFLKAEKAAAAISDPAARSAAELAVDKQVAFQIADDASNYGTLDKEPGEDYAAITDPQLREAAVKVTDEQLAYAAVSDALDGYPGEARTELGLITEPGVLSQATTAVNAANKNSNSPSAFNYYTNVGNAATGDLATLSDNATGAVFTVQRHTPDYREQN